MKNVRIRLQSAQFGLTEVSPVHSGKYAYARRSGGVDYIHTPEDAFKFLGKDYRLLTPMAADECRDVTMYVDRRCGGEWVPYWQGVFSWFDGTQDADKCTLEFEPRVVDAYKCLEDNKEEEFSAFRAGDVVETRTTAGTYESRTCRRFGRPEEPSEEDGPGTPASDCIGGQQGKQDWCLKSDRVTYGTPGGSTTDPDYYDTYEQITVWHRETAPGSCVNGSPQPPAYGEASEWTLLRGGCGSGQDEPVFWRCPGAVIGPYTRGRRFNDVLVAGLDASCAALAIKSDFFGINPAGDAPANGAYAFAAAKLHHLTFHQKSDVKRPGDTNGAFGEAWRLKFLELMNDLRKAFNVRYVVRDGVFILEHVSYFDSGAVVGLDLSEAPKKRVYSFDKARIFRRERFFWMDRTYYGPFQSLDIYNDCGQGEEEITLSYFTTDAAYITDARNAERVEDEGFVLIANDYTPEGHYVPIDGNSPLKWRELHANLHRHGRAYRSGKINGQQQDFLSYERFRSLEPFSAAVCCDAGFDPGATPVVDGQPGTVKNASENLVTNHITFELAF